jgi:hypothetical protein
MSLDDMVLRKEIAITIIERCRHLSPDLSACDHCIESAKVAWGDQFNSLGDKNDLLKIWL